jgi:hypothetical protein
MQISFYNVKKREIVSVPLEKIQKRQYERKSRKGAVSICYALKAVDGDGTNLTKFCNSSDWNSI